MRSPPPTSIFTCTSTIAEKQHKYYSRETAPKKLVVQKPVNVNYDYPCFRDAGNPPGDLPEPDLLEGEEANRRNAARVMYCDLHEIYEEDLLDEDVFADPASFEFLPNVSDVAAGRDVQPPTSEKK